MIYLFLAIDHDGSILAISRKPRREDAMEEFKERFILDIEGLTIKEFYTLS